MHNGPAMTLYTCTRYLLHGQTWYYLLLFVYHADTATRLGSTADTDDEDSSRMFSSPKPPTKSVSWASSVTSSSDEQQEIVFLRSELKEAMKENLEYVVACNRTT